MSRENWRRGPEASNETPAQFRITTDQFALIEAQAKSGLNRIPKTDGEAYFSAGVQSVLDIISRVIVVS